MSFHLNHHQIWLQKAYAEARYSKDPSTQNGAIIVNNGEIIGAGYNKLPTRVADTLERWQRPEKYNWVEHAERNAIYDAARHGNKTGGATIYCPWFACTDCARAIIQSGIIEVIGHDTPIHDEGSELWKQSITKAYQMFDEAGISYRHIKGEMNTTIRFNGEIVYV